MGSNLWQLSNKIMLCRLSPRARLISKTSFLVASEVLQDLSVSPVSHLRYALNFSGNVPSRYRRYVWYCTEGRKGVPWISHSTFPSSCYASLYSVISYIFLRPIHGNVGNDSDVTSFTDDKHVGLNCLGQRGLEGSARHREDEALSFATRAIRRSPIRGLSTAVVKMLLVNPPINVPRVTYRPTFVTETCHTSAGAWRLNRLNDSFRGPAACTLSSSVFLRVRGLDWNRGSAVGVVTGIWAEQRRNCDSILGRRKRYVPDPKLPERLWDLSSILLSGYLGFSLGLK